MNIPKNLNNNEVYMRWRGKKLENYPRKVEDITVKVGRPGYPSKKQIKELKRICSKTNMAIYQATEEIVEDKNIALNMGSSVGLKILERSLTTGNDGVSTLSTTNSEAKGNYIPYTNKPLGWHTDGCYNDADQLINGFILHCVRSAEQGGENHLLDPDIAYILLRDENPEFIDGLMLPDALTIPRNSQNNHILREKKTGPILTIRNENCRTGGGTIHFRYTARKTFVDWKEDTRIMGALNFLKQTLQNKCPYIFRVKLNPGSGIIGNNVLHNRTKFQDGDSEYTKRLIYRIYYQDRIGMNQI